MAIDLEELPVSPGSRFDLGDSLQPFSHARYLAGWLRKRDVSTGELPKDCSLVGFDAVGYSKLCPDQLRSFALEIDVLTVRIARRFELLLVANPTGDGASFIALPPFDEDVFLRFIEQTRVGGLSMRGDVTKIEEGSAFLHRLSPGRLGLSGHALSSHERNLNGGGSSLPLDRFSDRPYSALQLDLDLLKSARDHRGVLMRRRGFIQAHVFKACEGSSFIHPEDLMSAIPEALVGAPSSVVPFSAHDGLLLLVDRDPNSKWHPNRPSVTVRAEFTSAGSLVLPDDASIEIRNTLKGKNSVNNQTLLEAANACVT